MEKMKYSKEQLLETIDFFEENKIMVNNLLDTAEDEKYYSKLFTYYQTLNKIIKFLYDAKLDGFVISFSAVKQAPRKYFNFFHQLGMYKNGYYPKEVLKDDEIKYIDFIINIVETKLTSIGLNLETGRMFSHEVPRFNELNKTDPIYNYVSKNSTLSLINRQRRRNITIFNNEFHEVIYDLFTKGVSLRPKISFSDIEHDTNRKFVEDVILNILYNFNNKKSHYIKLLSKKKKMYQKEIEIVKGNKIPTDNELLVLISLLGRLEQENRMGPISVFREEKLNPNLILKHSTNLRYIKETINTFREYQKIISSNNDLIKLIPNYNFNIIRDGITESQLLIPTIKESPKPTKPNISTSTIIGTVESPNYLLSFFTKFTKYEMFNDILPLYNSNETLTELIEYSKRYKGSPKEQDFVISAKTRAILKTAEITHIKEAIIGVFNESRSNTYSKRVSNHILKQENEYLKEILRMFIIFENHVQDEKTRYKEEVGSAMDTGYNESYLSISSDMHFNNLSNFEKSNFSSNFNIIVGDFADNLFHRGGVELEGLVDIHGIGVLGNHDIYLQNKPTNDLKKEIVNNYSNSIDILSQLFPNIKILNDEIIYKDGYAIVGLTLFYDLNKGEKTFFANRDWGKLFDNDDYLKRATTLLDKVEKTTPIIFLSHSPFKEYSQAKNKDIGVPSNYIFRKYPNVKMYIHGHGHSSFAMKKIENVLCITNPLVMNRSLSEVSFTQKQLNVLLKLNRSKIIKHKN